MANNSHTLLIIHGERERERERERGGGGREGDTHLCLTLIIMFLPLQVVKQNKEGYGLAADIWSLGCTVLEMLTRQLPYSHLENSVRSTICYNFF